MNTLKQIASRAMVFVLALAVLVPALIMAGDNNSVQAEKLATVYLTNKGTGFTTEASPPSARSNPASRKNASTVYVTMTDVDTANDVKNSHILNANKVVITVVESDYNKKVSATSGNLAITAAGTANTKTLVIPGKAGDPVIDSDGDGDLSDEVGFVICQDGQVPVFTGSAVSSACAAPEGPTAQIVSVANGDSATSTSATPMITVYITGQGGDSAEDNDDAFVGYYTSAVNTFQVKAWSTVQLESNASDISVVETGRNTGVFEAEFLVADTEGVNDNTAALDAQNGWNATAGNAFGTGGKVPQSLNAAVAAGIANSADGRFDASDGQSADAEWTLIADNLDVGGAIATSGGNTSGTITLPAGSWIADPDGDGSITDSFVLLDDGGGTDIVDANHGTGTTVNTVTCSGTVDTTCTKPTAAARTIVLNITPTAAIANGVSDVADIAAIVSDNVVNNQKFDTNNSLILLMPLTLRVVDLDQTHNQVVVELLA